MDRCPLNHYSSVDPHVPLPHDAWGVQGLSWSPIFIPKYASYAAQSFVPRFKRYMGCFGAIRGLSVAKAIARESPTHRVLLVCTELCSLHFQADHAIDTFIGNALFSDGAAGVIVGNPAAGESPSWEIVN